MQSASSKLEAYVYAHNITSSDHKNDEEDEDAYLGDDTDDILEKKESKSKFISNLKNLYQRRVASAFELMDRIKIHQTHLNGWSNHLSNIENQLT